MPPEFLLGGCSRVEYDRTTGEAVGPLESLATLGRLTGLVDKYRLLGSLAETLLLPVRLLLLPDESNGLPA